MCGSGLPVPGTCIVGGLSQKKASILMIVVCFTDFKLIFDFFWHSV
jgi:hypothetical protein